MWGSLGCEDRWETSLRLSLRCTCTPGKKQVSIRGLLDPVWGLLRLKAKAKTSHFNDSFGLICVLKKTKIFFK